MEPVLAPLGRRAIGLFIDQIVAAVPMILLFLALGYQFDEMVAGTPGFWFNIGFVAIGLLHETIGVFRFGRTVGKLSTGTRVVHAVSLGAVSLSSAFIRSLVPAAFGVVPGIGMILGMGVYLWAFFDPRRQGIHDKAAGTLVVLKAQPA
jgi:uncharacterized RDD family membrane protein YckC